LRCRRPFWKRLYVVSPIVLVNLTRQGPAIVS
jgi:hypothetical protein